jgi:tetratricopeptide (TPR) repeat protein
MKYIVAFVFVLIIGACKKPNEQAQNEKSPVVVSLLGETFYEPEYSEATQHRLDSNLAVAKANFREDPSEENTIWLGRRLAYLSRYNEAIQIFNEGLERFPDSYKLLRHRGHRFISMRLFDSAMEDLTKASTLMPTEWEMEPDGQPNRLNQPLSTTQFNIWYHLALAHYLKDDFDKAEQAYAECLKVSNNDDLLVATIDWFYMTYRREGKDEPANGLLENITDSMNIIENDSYYKRLRMYQGHIEPDQLLTVDASDSDPDLSLATQGYGVGNWYYYNGDTTKAIAVFRKVVSGKHFSAFGFIAAEADLARMNDK